MNLLSQMAATQSTAAEAALFNVLLGKDGRKKDTFFLNKNLKCHSRNKLLNTVLCSWFYDLTILKPARKGDILGMGSGEPLFLPYIFGFEITVLCQPG